MGLIAREIEAAGVPTLAMTSAWDITRAVQPPRSAYVHRPLGHQTGTPGSLRSQVDTVRAALEAAPEIARGEIRDLGRDWGSPGWEARAYTPEETPVGPDGKPLRD
ncbi:MAG: hypothetical protein ACE5IL_13780 [Myxococcota bacterium]